MPRLTELLLGHPQCICAICHAAPDKLMTSRKRADIPAFSAALVGCPRREVLGRRLTVGMPDVDRGR